MALEVQAGEQGSPTRQRKSEAQAKVAGFLLRAKRLWWWHRQSECAGVGSLLNCQRGRGCILKCCLSWRGEGPGIRFGGVLQGLVLARGAAMCNRL